MYSIILYYNFFPIDDPDNFCLTHKQKCSQFKLKGRIYIACEGINGTLAGKIEHIEQYKKYLRSFPGFENTPFKEDVSKTVPFTKLIVKTRSEIVSLKSAEPIDPTKESGKYLSPHQWRQMLESGEDYILLDVRNNYESRIGHFRGAIRPDVKNFFDFPQWLKETNIPKNKKVLMYCTGGIRCEKFSLLMRREGFQDVYQLYGGIMHYAKEEGGIHFKGKCFVFDDRLAVVIDKKEKEPITFCEITGNPCDRYLNCANLECNKLFICSQEGALKFEGCCSQRCQKTKKKRPFNPDDIYSPTRKWHHYRDQVTVHGY